MEGNGYITKTELWGQEESINYIDFFRAIESYTNDMLQNLRMNFSVVIKEFCGLLSHENQPYLILNSDKLSVIVKTFKCDSLVVSVDLETPSLIDTQEISSSQPIIIEKWQKDKKSV